ncbi:hypothetical protein, partial [Enterobacter hormaechei]|uniref:hypothetical protein n=1 Tax=Enterobacter hormaechei TaxID=158836 RepID=UPI001952CE8A
AILSSIALAMGSGLPPLLSRDDGALEASCALLCVSCALALEGSIYAIRLAPGAWCLALGLE